MGFLTSQLSAQSIVYMSRIGEYDHFDKLGNSRLKKAFMGWVFDNELYEDSTIYEIKWDELKDTPPQQCRYDICLAAGADCPINETMHRGEIPCGNYAVFCIENNCMRAESRFWEVFTESLRKSKLEYDETKPILKRYIQKLVFVGRCEFCVPVQCLREWWEL